MLNTKYLVELLQQSRNELEKEIRVDNINFDEFELVNSFLIYRALNQSNYSLSINYPNRDDKRDFYIPTLLSVAATLFFQNFVDDKTSYEVGEVVQKDGKRYRIIEKRDNDYIISSDDPGKTRIFPSRKGIRKYIVTTADLSKRQVRTKFDNYRNLFKLLFEEEYVPSKFSYKSAIIVERKEFLESLSVEKVPDIDLKKAIPFKWVTKKGFKKDESEYIPIEPMIYLLPDYETFKEFVLEDIDKLDSVVFIGRNKYIPFITRIRKDLRNKTIPKAIFIGSSEIESFSNLRTWRWTHNEINYFENDGDSSGTISFTSVTSEEFLQSIKQFEDRILEIEDEFCFNLRAVHRLKKYLHSLIFPNPQSRITSQKEFIKHAYIKEIQNVLYESFLEINRNPSEYIEELSNYIDEILGTIPTVKYDFFSESNQASILIVPDRFVETWKEEILKGQSGRHQIKYRILSFKEFKKKHNHYKTYKQVYFLTLFGYADFPIDIFRFITQSHLNYHFVLYPEEEQIAKNVLVKATNELIREYKSDDREYLSGITYPSVEKEETLTEMMERIYGQDNIETRRGYEYDSDEQVEYEITFSNSESIVVDGSKKILLEGGTRRKETVSNLIVGDRIRVYENTSKERLFDIAVESDDKGIFDKIIQYSKLWKQCLINYFTEKRSSTFTENHLLEEIQRNGGKIQIAALKKWLNIEDRVLFPSEIVNLFAIKETISCQILNENFDRVKQNRKLYRGIMIAIGRDLSDEIMDYIISDNRHKGEILKRFSDVQIKSIINASAPLLTIESIRIIESSDNE